MVHYCINGQRVGKLKERGKRGLRVVHDEQRIPVGLCEPIYTKRRRRYSLSRRR